MSILLEQIGLKSQRPAQAGHSDPKMTLGIYAQVIASKTDHGAALDGLIGGETAETARTTAAA